MSKERWEPGDIALCVTTERWENLVTDEISTGPRRGSVNQVVRITVFNGMTMLRFAAWPEEYFEAAAFRKIERLTREEHREAVRELAEDQFGKVRR